MRNKFSLVAFVCVGLFTANMGFNFFEDYRNSVIAEAVVKDINQTKITAKFIGNTIVLEGEVSSYVQKDRAMEIAKAHVMAFRLRNLVDKPQVLDMIMIKSTIGAL